MDVHIQCVWRRYSQFRALREQLQALLPAAAFAWVPDIDGKRLTGNLSPEVTLARKESLNGLLTAIVLHLNDESSWDSNSSKCSDELLDEDTMKHKAQLIAKTCRQKLHVIIAAAFPMTPKLSLVVFVVKDQRVLDTIR